MNRSDGEPVSRVRALERWTDDARVSGREAVAEEVPVALAYNGISHAVMLATPADLDDFGIGFSLSEGIVASYGEIRDLETTVSDEGITVDIAISNAAFAALKERRRNLAGRTGCGLCGTESLAQVFRPLPRVNSSFALDVTALRTLAVSLSNRQPLHAETGAVHAAGWGRSDGSIELVREDVGRHNALDKLIGALAQQHTEFGNGAALLTSRASSEIVQKAATVGIPLVAAISAPTGLAIRIAEDCGVSLIAWLRGRRFAVFAHGARLRMASAEIVG